MAGEEPGPRGLIYDFFQEEGARLGQRTDWFLIFHAILLEAFFNVQDHDANHSWSQLVVGVLGFLVSYLWFVTGFRQRWISRHYAECMKHEGIMGPEVSRLLTNLFDIRRQGLPTLVGWAQPVPTFAVVIPCAFAIAWFILLVLHSSRPLLASTAVAVTIVAATIWIRFLRDGPKICQEFVNALNTKSASSSSEVAEPNSEGSEGREKW
jgi:hypothetical protein